MSSFDRLLLTLIDLGVVGPRTSAMSDRTPHTPVIDRENYTALVAKVSTGELPRSGYGRSKYRIGSFTGDD
jgi:hypothetical protein